jgi:hypothetical protein
MGRASSVDLEIDQEAIKDFTLASRPARNPARKRLSSRKGKRWKLDPPPRREKERKRAASGGAVASLPLGKQATKLQPCSKGVSGSPLHEKGFELLPFFK